MSSGQTYPERRWPQTPEFTSVLRRWRVAGSSILLRFAWQAYDRLCVGVLAQLDPSIEDEEIERSITQQLEPEIQKAMTGFEPFYVQHGPYENETRAVPPAQPPEYDIAFILRDNPRIMWPLEAKVLKSDGTVAAYITEIRDNYLTCRYSPFSGEAAMLAYLLSGDPSKVFANIAKKGGWKLRDHPDFPKRSHKTSDHERNVTKDKPYPVNFRCHHLIFQLQTN